MKKPTIETPPQRYARLRKEHIGMDYEGWCRSMGHDYLKTGWGRQLEAAKREAEEWDARKWAEILALRADGQGKPATDATD